MNHYAFRVYKGTYNNPKFAGTISANSMGDAVKVVMKKNNITSVKEVRNGLKYTDFMLNSEKVGIVIYANPEDYNHI